MLNAGRARVKEERLSEQIDLREGRAESLPFADAEFDALTFTYLLRYVDDPAATMREIARVVRPGGTIAMLEFGVPSGLWRPLWELYVRVGLPGAGALVSPAWQPRSPPSPRPSNNCGPASNCWSQTTDTYAQIGTTPSPERSLIAKDTKEC